MYSKAFSFLKPAPNAEPINDKQKMDKMFKYWRLRVLYTTLIGYSAFYLVRKSLSVAMPAIEQEFDFSKAHLGIILTIFGITYGVSKFINGFVGDRTNPRYFMALGLICSALVNVFFGLSSSIIAFGLFWILNGWFQGMGWAPCSKTLVQWFSAKERGTKFSICNTSTSIGAAAVTFLNGYLVVKYGWKACFFVPATLAALGALFILNRLRDKPQSLGLPAVEEYTGEEPDIGEAEEDNSDAYKRTVRKFIFGNPMMWIVCFANFFVYVVRYAILDWGPTFLSETRGIDLQQAAWIVGGYELAGIAGMLVGGLAMDKMFKGFGGRTCAIYMALCTAVIVVFWKFPIQTLTLNGLLLWAMGFFIYGPQCLIAVIAANMVPKKVAAAAVGLTGLFGYLSTVISGWGLGAIVDKFGWNTGFLMLAISAAIGMLLFVISWNTNPHLPGSAAHEQHNSKATVA